MQVADVTSTPNQPLILVKKIGTQPSANLTIIGSDIQGGDATQPDIKIEVASAQGALTIISSTVKFVEAESQRPVIISGLSTYTFVGSTIPVYIAHTGRLRGIAGISSTAVQPLNLVGNATFVSAATVAISFASNEEDSSYEIFVGTQLNETLWVTSKATTGFTLNSSNASSTAVVSWLLIR